MKSNSKILWIISTLIVLVILSIHMESMLSILRPSNEVWKHIREHLLFGYTVNTVSIVFVSMISTGIIGTLSAYLVTCFDFPGRKILAVALYLPLAIPPYIMAYVYFNMLGPFGLFHQLFGIIPPTTPFSNAALIFSLSLFPYVYIGVSGFIRQGMTTHIENARLLKKNERQIFIQVVLPIAKLAILTGMVLVGLEVLGDFAALQYLGVNTFATAIFRSWIVFRDFDSALRLSGIAMLSVFSLLVMKGFFMRAMNVTATNAKAGRMGRKQLQGKHRIFPVVFLSLIVIFSFVLPLYRLITWAVSSFGNVRLANLSSMLFNSTVIAFAVTLLILLLAIIIATSTRKAPKFIGVFYGKVTLISYALPGAIIAMVTLFFFIQIDRFFPFVITTTIIALIVGYVIRFLGLAYENVEDGYKKIGFRHHEAARTLGKGYFKTLLTVDIPMLKPFLISSIALVFIDLVRELPVTLVLRPFNYHTLATQVYQYASDERLAESAVPSLIIVAISLIFIIILLNNRRSNQPS